MKKALRSRLQSALLALGATSAALVAAEGLVRVLLPQPLRPAWDDEQDGLRVARPGIRGRHFQPGRFDVSVSINSQRFRATREYAPEPEAGRLRIAVLGDSMAFGWGAGDQDTYPAQLERMLTTRPVEVINAGYPGTCMGEKALWYVKGVRSYRPDVVVLTALGDDVDGDLYWRSFSLRGDGGAEPRATREPADPGVRSARRLVTLLPGYALAAERSQLLGLVRLAATRVLTRERTTALGQRPATAEEVRQFHGEGLMLLKAEVRWLADRVHNDGGRLALVFVPFRDSVYPAEGWWPDELRWKSRAVAAALGELCGELALPFRDLTAPLVARAATGKAPLYYEGIETHPTAAGYGAIAEEVAALLVSPDSASPQIPSADSRR